MIPVTEGLLTECLLYKYDLEIYIWKQQTKITKTPLKVYSMFNRPLNAFVAFKKFC